MKFTMPKVGVEFENQPGIWKFHSDAVIDATPEEVFKVLADGPSWSVWHSPIRNVQWSSEPFDVGTTRTIDYGSTHIWEYFYAWEPNKRMAFCFEATSMPTFLQFIAATEDYSLERVEGTNQTLYKRLVCIEPSSFLRYGVCGVEENLRKSFEKTTIALQTCFKEKKFNSVIG
jgi:hypothetical protein